MSEAGQELGYQLTRRRLAAAISRLHGARTRIPDVYASPGPAPAAGSRP